MIVSVITEEMVIIKMIGDKMVINIYISGITARTMTSEMKILMILPCSSKNKTLP